MKNIKRAIKTITLSSILCIALSVPIFANTTSNQNVLIEIERYTEPSGGWQPGDSMEIKFAIKNNTNMNMKINKIYMIEKSRLTLDEAFEVMADHTWITIKDGNTTIKESIELKKFLASDSNNSVSTLDNYISLSPGQIKELTMTIDMRKEMGNSAQSLSKVFSLGTVYTLSSTGGGGGGSISPPEKPEEPSEPTPPPTTPEDPDKPSNPGDGGTTLPENPNPGDEENNGSDVGGSEDGNGNGNKLPQTGGVVNGATLTALGVVVAGLGIALDRKSSDKGGKSDE